MKIKEREKIDNYLHFAMQNPIPVLENDTHKLLWDFDIQTNHLISAKRPDLIIINNNNNNKKKEFAKLSTLLSRLTTESNWKNVKRRISTSTLLGNWKTMDHEGDNYTNRDWCFWYSHQRIIKRTGERGNKRTSGDHPNYSIIENSQNK